MKWMIRNSRGKPDALLTFSAGAIVVVLLKVLVLGVVLPGGFSFGTIDAAVIAAVLTPTVGTYTWKRVKGGKNDEEPKP